MEMGVRRGAGSRGGVEESRLTSSSPPAQVPPAARRGLSPPGDGSRDSASVLHADPTGGAGAPPGVRLTSPSHTPEFGVNVVNKVTSPLLAVCTPWPVDMVPPMEGEATSVTGQGRAPHFPGPNATSVSLGAPRCQL